VIRTTKYWIRSDIGQLLSKWLNTAVTDLIIIIIIIIKTSGTSVNIEAQYS